MSKRQQQKQATRQRIREVAKALFSAQGFDATTSRQIATETGVAVGTLFVHFESKQAILTDILFEDIELCVRQAFATLDRSTSTVDQLLHLARALYSYYLAQADLSRTLLKHSLFENSATLSFSEQIERFIDAVTAIIEQGQANGEIPTAKNAGRMATTFMATYIYMLMWLLRREADAAVDEKMVLVDLALNELRSLVLDQING